MTPLADAIAEVDLALKAVSTAITDEQSAHQAHRNAHIARLDSLLQRQTELIRVRRRLREVDADATPVHEVRASSGVTRLPRGHAMDPVSARTMVDAVERANGIASAHRQGRERGPR